MGAGASSTAKQVQHVSANIANWKLERKLSFKIKLTLN
jgi:hypothetical protein